MTSVEEPVRPAGRLRDAARTRGEILDVATEEFARAGYDGARVDEIAARTRTTKRMIYYYFGGKEQLFAAVLERAYGVIREAGQRLDVEHLDPVAAIRRLAELVFDHHERHPDFVRLVGTGNMAAAGKPGRTECPALEAIRRALADGQASGLFRTGIDAVDLYAMISSFCVFRVAGRHTFGALFARDLLDPARREQQRTMLGDMVIAYLTAERPGG
ncbi:TetR/AcrR family transcriptional regulator [Streptomyces sp. NPDC001606]